MGSQGLHAFHALHAPWHGIEEEQSYDDGDKFDNINEATSQVRAQCAAVFEVEVAFAKWRESGATSNLIGRGNSRATYYREMIYKRC